MPKQFIVTPPFHHDVEIGPEGVANYLYVGKLAEVGGFRRVRFSAGKEFVVLIVGKRGSGKSYTLGVFLEGLATVENKTSLGELATRPGVVLLDPMMNFWPSAIPVTAEGPEKVRKQYLQLDGWQCRPEPSRICLWIPAGFKRELDYAEIHEFAVRVADLDPQDWADLCGVNLVRDPQGMLLGEGLEAVTETGWMNPQGQQIPPKKDYLIGDLIAWVEAGHSQLHRSDVVRALVRTLRSWERQPVFKTQGTRLVELVRPGWASILMLPQRVGHDLRRVITRVLIRRLLKERELASQIRQRLDVEILPEAQRLELQAALTHLVPKTVLALDEAQELLGEEGGEARTALEDFCLLGRNYGLSLILATQRPTATALSPKVRAQVDTYFIHRLLTQEDIDLSYKNLISEFPQEVRLGHTVCDFALLVRSLDTGQAVVASDRVFSRDGRARSFVMDVRGRTRVHGGEVA